MAAGANVVNEDDREIRRRKRRRQPVEEPTPVISGRFLIAGLLIAILALIPQSKLGNLFEPKDPVAKPGAWQVGKNATVQITLVTADYNKLACASPTVLEGAHCAFKAETESYPRDPNAPLDDNKANIIQPYRTWLDNQLILVVGLWAQPALALRLHREPSAGIEESKLARFVTECEVKFIGELAAGSKLRWNPGQWVPPDQRAIVAKPISCKILAPEGP